MPTKVSFDDPPVTDADTIAATPDMTAEFKRTIQLDQVPNVDASDCDNHTDGTNNKVFTAAEETKLSGIAPGATANLSDGLLLNRVNHLGTQPLSTISDAGTAASSDASDFATAAQGATADSAIQPNTNATLADLVITGVICADEVVDNGNSGVSGTIDFTTGTFQQSTLTDNCTYTFTNPSGPCTVFLKTIQDATGSRTITWPVSVMWTNNNTPPTISTTALAVDFFCFVYDGSNYYGVHSWKGDA